MNRPYRRQLESRRLAADEGQHADHLRLERLCILAAWVESVVHLDESIDPSCYLVVLHCQRSCCQPLLLDAIGSRLIVLGLGVEVGQDPGADILIERPRLARAYRTGGQQFRPVLAVQDDPVLGGEFAPRAPVIAPSDEMQGDGIRSGGRRDRLGARGHDRFTRLRSELGDRPPETGQCGRRGLRRDNIVRVPVRAQNVSAHIAYGQLPREALLTYPLKLCSFLGRRPRVLAVVIFVCQVGADEVPVELGDDVPVGERTRSQCKSATSAASSVNPAISCVEENRPVVLLAELNRGPNIGDPADLVEALILGSRLSLRDGPLDPADDLPI
jgi:hypothetical protein